MKTAEHRGGTCVSLDHVEGNVGQVLLQNPLDTLPLCNATVVHKL